MTRSLRTGARVAVPAIVLAGLALAGCSSASSSPPASSASAARAGSTGTKSSASPLVIGVMGSFTGVASGSTADAKVLTQDWVSATNASGGINGHPVQAIYLDDLNTPSTALTKPEQLA